MGKVVRVYTKEGLAREEFEKIFYTRKEALAFARKKRKEKYEAKVQHFNFHDIGKESWVVSGRKKYGVKTL